MDNSNPKVPETPPTSPMSEDLSGSVSSEVFESWTLVSDKSKTPKKVVAFVSEAQEVAEEDSDGSANRVEILNSDHDDTESSKSTLETPTKPTDDLSDGISVISDSESEMRNTTSNVRLRFTSTDIHEFPSTSHVTADDSSGENQQMSRLRRRRSSDPSSNSLRTSMEVKTSMKSYPATIRCGLTGLFYVGVILAILGFIGKLRYPEWNTSSTIEAFEAKLNDLEMHNNLMRAEIDILSKQVDYLTSMNENNQRYKSRDEKSYPSRNGQNHRNNQRQNGQNNKKPFKTPPGAANTDMWNEKPIECDNDKIYNDIAGVCVARLDKEVPSSNAGHEIPSNSKNYEDKIHKLDEKFAKGEQTQSPYSKNGKKQHNFENGHDKYQNIKNDGKYNSKENYKHHDFEDKYHNRGKPFQEHNYRPHHKNGDYDGSGDKHKHKKFEEHNHYNKGDLDNGFKDKHKFEEHNYRSKHNDNDGSGDKHKREENNYRKDHHKNGDDDDSRERFDQHKPKKYQDHEDGRYKHQSRESYPKFDERQRDGKNWFIARGDGRQQARFTGGRRRR